MDDIDHVGAAEQDPIDQRTYPATNHVFVPVDDDVDIIDAERGTGHPIEALIDDIAGFVDIQISTTN